MLSKDDIVVELQAEPKTEQAVLLKGVNGGQKTPADHQVHTLLLSPRPGVCCCVLMFAIEACGFIRMSTYKILNKHSQ